MHHHLQYVIVIRQAQQAHPDQWTRGQIERLGTRSSQAHAGSPIPHRPLSATSSSSGNTANSNCLVYLLNRNTLFALAGHQRGA